VTDLAEIGEPLAPGRTDDVDLAEKVVLGTMITEWMHAAEEILNALGDDKDCFAGQGHSAVFAAVSYLAESGRPVGPASVLARLAEAEQGTWRTSQAGIIIHGLMQHATPVFHEQVATVVRASRQRVATRALRSALESASRPGFDADEHGDLIIKSVTEALTGTSQAATSVTAASLFLATVERLESPEPPGVIQFPWAELRRLVPYLRPGQLVSVLARPSLGKSLVAQDTARYNGLRRQIPCVLFTLEQDRDEVMDRLLAAEAGVLHEHITGRELTDDDWSRIAAARGRFEDSSLVIDDAPKISVAHIRARLRGLARTAPAQLAIVDYLQLMDSGPAQAESRQREVSAIVAGLKAVAREFRIPVLMCCQLNRGPESRQDKRPHVSDARETGSVENDSDIAILIHREDFYEPESPRAGEADLIVDKHRGGPRGTATIRFQGHYARFVDPEWSPSSAIGAQA
jgi:replicative DNA helicase